MAQIELRIFKEEIWDRSNRENLKGFCDGIKRIVADVHYGIKELSPGDVTLVVPRLDHDLSDSDADIELEVSEGSENWASNHVGTHASRGKTIEEILQMRARMISNAILAGGYANNSHNIFVVTGEGTGWHQYKPEPDEGD